MNEEHGSSSTKIRAFMLHKWLWQENGIYPRRMRNTWLVVSYFLHDINDVPRKKQKTLVDLLVP